jgi:serine/threonine protein kinase
MKTKYTNKKNGDSFLTQLNFEEFKSYILNTDDIDINYMNPKTNEYLISYFVKYDKTEFINLLLENGSINYSDIKIPISKIVSPPNFFYNDNKLSNDDTLIKLLQNKKEKEALSLINKNQIDSNYFNNYNTSAFSWACYHKYSNIVEILYKKGFDKYYLKDINNRICMDYMDNKNKYFYKLILSFTFIDKKIDTVIDKIKINSKEDILEKFVYNTKNKLGEGSYASVVDLIHRKTKNIFIVKLYKTCDKFLIDESTFTEIRILNKLNSCNTCSGLVDFYGIFKYDKCFNLILEKLVFNLVYINERWFSYLKIEDLNTQYLKIFKQLLNGLKSIHCLGYIHNDLKSDNIMVDIFGNVKIFDFGLASFIGINPKQNFDFYGTYNILAPDSHKLKFLSITLNGKNKEFEINKPNYCSDIYSLGCVILGLILNLDFLAFNTKLYIIDKCIYIEKIHKKNIELSIYTDINERSLEILDKNNLFDLLCNMMEINSVNRFDDYDCLSHYYFNQKKIKNDNNYYKCIYENYKNQIVNIYDKITLSFYVEDIFKYALNFDFKINLLLLLKKYPNYECECLYITYLKFNYDYPMKPNENILNNIVLNDIENFDFLPISSIIEYYSLNNNNNKYIIENNIYNYCKYNCNETITLDNLVKKNFDF